MQPYSTELWFLYLNSGLGNVDICGQLLSHHYIRVVRFSKRALQDLQLLMRERSARASMLPSGGPIMHFEYDI